MSLRIAPYLLTLSMAGFSALAACSPDDEADDALHQPALISTLEFLNKNFPVLKKAPTITPAEISVGENVAITVEWPAGAKNLWAPVARGAAGSTAVLETADGGFRIQQATVATVVADKYVPEILIATMTPEEETAQAKLDEANQPSAFRQNLSYSYDPAKSKTHYVVTASCTGGAYEEHMCGFGYRGTAEEKYKAELAAGVVSDLPIASFTVAASGIDFAAAITGVAAAGAGFIHVFYSVTNNGTADAASVKISLWSNLAAPPVAGNSSGNSITMALAAGETFTGTWANLSLSWSSGQTYHPYVLVDSEGVYAEANEDDNAATLAWTAP